LFEPADLMKLLRNAIRDSLTLRQGTASAVPKENAFQIPSSCAASPRKPLTSSSTLAPTSATPPAPAKRDTIFY
jgi:hypothetical protein